MHLDSDIDELKARRICIECIREPYLCGQVESANDNGTCSYCNREDVPTITIEELAGEVAGALERHYEVTANDPDDFEYATMNEGVLDWDRHGDPVAVVIAEAARIDDEPAEDVRCVLEDENEDIERAQMGDEGPFDEDAHYEAREIDDAEFRAEWDAFEQALTREARFFNKSAEAVLDMVFKDIVGAKTRSGEPVIRVCGPGTELTALFRARAFQSDGRLQQAIKFPDREVGYSATIWMRTARQSG